MASTTSLGIHKPSALAYLVAEGILPPEPSQTLYSWKIICAYGPAGYGEEEEILTTKSCVAWSKAGVVQRIYRFEVESEPISQALLTQFPKGSQNATQIAGLHVGFGIYGLEAQNAHKHGTRSAKSNITTEHHPSSKSIYEGRSFQPDKYNGKDCRALVVVLRTQAHVFFLSGTSHIIHLPFEIDSAFSLRNGVLLQRKTEETVVAQLTPLIPSVPVNSFALSQLNSSRGLSNSQGVQDVINGQTNPLPARSTLSSAGDLFSAPRKPLDRALPRHFCFTDPLSEMGIVLASPGLPTRAGQGRNNAIHENLDAAETVIYISSKDELEYNITDSVLPIPVTLALTMNNDTGGLTLWSVTYVGRHSRPAGRPHYNPAASGTMSRRRSSHGPGATTGANTPVQRNPRQSYGDAGQSFAYSSFLPNDVDMATKLDPAFENPAAPARSSRRVSSLLARADLSTSHDNSTFSDVLGGYDKPSNVRRGPSLSSQGTRMSTGINHSIQRSKNRVTRSFGDSQSFTNVPIESILDEVGSEDDMSGSSEPSVHDNVHNSRTEMVFKSIRTFPNKSCNVGVSSATRAAKDLEVFTLSSSILTNAKVNRTAEIVMCLVDRENRTLLILRILVYIYGGKHDLGSTNATDSYKYRIIDFSWVDHIIDACKVFTGDCSRILVLCESADGYGDLTLQAPWSTSKKLYLPAQLLSNNPFQITHDVNRGRKQEGDLKRVPSKGPQKLTALQHSANLGLVDILDQDSTRHRIKVKMLPSSDFTRQIICLCETIVPTTDAEREPMLRGWWEVFSWLDRRIGDDKSDWTAFVVLLFSMAHSVLDNRRVQKSSMDKKRKGLLRSSNNANVDMEDWNAMFAQECESNSPSPPWMQEKAWGWTGGQLNLDATQDMNGKPLRKSRPSSSTPGNNRLTTLRSSFLLHCMNLAREFVASPEGVLALGKQGFLPTAISQDASLRRIVLPTILVGLHLFREENKLDVAAANKVHMLTPLLAQLGGWLNWQSWSWKDNAYYMLESADMDQWDFDDTLSNRSDTPQQVIEPPSVLRYIEDIIRGNSKEKFLTLLNLVSSLRAVSSYSGACASETVIERFTPISALLMELLDSRNRSAQDFVADMVACRLNVSALESLPEGISALLRQAISTCQALPLSTWTSPVLALIDRDDISMLESTDQSVKWQGRSGTILHHEAYRDVHSICVSTLETETVGAYDGSAEVDRQSISRMIFRDDQRFSEAAKLVHPLKPATARCNPEPEWSDGDLLEAQQEVVKIIAIRTLSVSPGRGMLFYSARLPLLTEKFPIHGFTLSCVMQPANITFTADRNIYTEEKVSWAFFHAGVEAGLSISRSAKGVDTSWIIFNKPAELSNRHAGFLLALGLNGHLKSIAKWVAFKYLTPKHTMTSIGLLLGLSASYLGTMDTLITRLLSVHVTRMLPPGAAELNLSPLTQTTGIMGIGLLYCNTQHRRMSEIMLSEMENTEQDDNSSPMDNLRDEGYRLAAGFALGYINLGRGKDLKGLHDMHIVERLLALAAGTRRVDIVHILDKATAAATIAIALIFMKTQNEALVRKIDIPDTTHQFDYVRPDIFLLRTVARHLIMWDNISATIGWMRKQLPLAYQPRVKLTHVRVLTTEDMPLFNITAGLCLSIGLRFAGTGSKDVRNLLAHYLDQFMRITRLSALNYDSKLTRITARNCQDAVALAACSVMAGTGDLDLLRRLRSLHGRTDPDTPFGSHLAAHLAIGVLFLGGGTYTFSTSNIAIASLLCAFYPLFPTTVLDNKSHLQAFRHFWVLAAEPRCLVARDADTQRPVSIPVLITLRTGSELSLTAPCLVPEVETIASIRTNDPEYWCVTLDFVKSSAHLSAFKRHQSIYVRKRGAHDAHSSVFSATLQAINDVQVAHQMNKQVFDWIFELPSLRHFDRAERALVLPPDESSALHKGIRGTVVDDRLVLENECIVSERSEKLWNLRVLFAWAERRKRDGQELEWLRSEVIEGLSARIRLEAREWEKGLE
ncbi:Anaphase-promoting complex subunit 1 [Schaereria dolodes]|nr:Anaphase-promoting complex subunit 1 [Schaereria dolodes]